MNEHGCANEALFAQMGTGLDLTCGHGLLTPALYGEIIFVVLLSLLSGK